MASLLYYNNLCVSFQIHRWIKTEVTVRKHSVRVKIGDFLSGVTLKFDGWPWNTIGHLFYTTSRLVHHFKPMGEFKLELQSGNDEFGSKSQFFVPCDLEIWRVTLKNNRAPLLCYFKICASFFAMGELNWGYSPETPNLGQNQPFFSRMTLKFDGWSWKTIGYISYQHQALCIVSWSFVNPNWSYGPETAKLGVALCDRDLSPLTLTFCMDVTFVIGNNCWKFPDDKIMET